MFGGANRRRAEKAQGRTVPGVVILGNTDSDTAIARGARKLSGGESAQTIFRLRREEATFWQSLRKETVLVVRPTQRQTHGVWSPGCSPRPWSVRSEIRFADGLVEDLKVPYVSRVQRTKRDDRTHDVVHQTRSRRRSGPARGWRGVMTSVWAPGCRAESPRSRDS